MTDEDDAVTRLKALREAAEVEMADPATKDYIRRAWASEVRMLTVAIAKLEAGQMTPARGRSLVDDLKERRARRLAGGDA